VDLEDPSGAPVEHDIMDGAAMGWIEETTLCISGVRSGGSWTGELWKIRPVEDHAGAVAAWTREQVPLDDPTDCAGNTLGASHGHWASVLGGPGGFRYVVDGRPFAMPVPAGGLSLDGEWLGFQVRDDAKGWPSAVMKIDGTQYREISGAINFRRVFAGGVLSYQTGTDIWLSYPDGQVERVNLSTTAPMTETIAVLVEVAGVPWVWTFSYGPAGVLVLGRPKGDPTCVRLPMAGLDLDVAAGPRGWTVAGTDDRGQLTVYHAVPYDAPRQPILGESPLPVHVAPIGRPLEILYYKVAGRYRDAMHPDGDYVVEALAGAATGALLGASAGDFDLGGGQDPVALTTQAIREIVALGKHFLIDSCEASIACAAPYWDHCAGVGVSAEAEAGVSGWDSYVARCEAHAAAAAALLEAHGLAPRVISAYFDGDISTGSWRMPVGCHAVQIRGYLGPASPDTIAEAQQQLRDLLARQLALVPGNVPVYLVAQDYDRSGAWGATRVPTTLAALQPVYADVARDDARVQGLFRFAYSRPGGTRTYAGVLRPWHEAFFHAMGGVPPAIIVPEDDVTKEDVVAAVQEAQQPLVEAINRLAPAKPAPGPGPDLPDVGTMQKAIAHYDDLMVSVSRPSRHLAWQESVHLVRVLFVEGGDQAAIATRTIHDWAGR
jgi:hypothetical protein